ncbi:helix-turn-helix transcriptional regulator [Lysinibacillus sp. NPDC056232]|uniref:helix-turn-helix transcriptional regulator n=1 Tax=Lysinibacillus sp. NPDC056232 TaxID=3345756 RepID=UPI0035D72642
MNEMGEKIRIALIKRGMTLTQLAEKLEVSQPNLSKKLKRNNFNEEELRKIAELLDMKFEAHFIMEDGTKI